MCLDCIFTIAQLVEKRREYQVPTYIAFIDFEKVFDRANRNKLWAVKRDPTISNQSNTESLCKE